MTQTAAHIRAVAKYNAKTYDQLKISVPKGWKDRVKAAADEVDDQQVNGIRCEELSQDADQAEQHGDDQRADRNTVLGGLGEEFRRLSEFAERPEISCARVCPVVAGCKSG